MIISIQRGKTPVQPLPHVISYDGDSLAYDVPEGIREGRKGLVALLIFASCFYKRRVPSGLKQSNYIYVYM